MSDASPSAVLASTLLAPLAVDVVSVQSQVVYGRVGNNVAVPTLQTAGLNVVAVPTVILSNTPHYPSLHGGAVPIDWFCGYLDDLEARGALAGLRSILVGYLGGPEQAAALARWIARMHLLQPGLQVQIDPVIGDHDTGVYVDPAMLPVYREHLLPMAHGLTPNGFELERLTGRPTGTMEQSIAAARTLLVGHTQWVVVTSAAPDSWTDGRMRVAVVNRADAQTVEHDRVDAAPKGTGDLFSAVLHVQLLAGIPLLEATRHACARVVDAVAATHRACSAELLLPGTP